MRPRILLFFVLAIIILAASCRQELNEEEQRQNKKADSLSMALNSPQLKEINKRILEDPSNAGLYNERARIYLSLKFPEDAVNDGKRAIRLDSTRADYYLTLVDAYFTRNNTRQAKELLEITVKKFPENAEALLKLAEIYFLVRQYQAAIDHVNKALRIDDRNARAYYIKGSVYRESGDTAKAISSLETATEQDNRYEDAYYDLGLMYAARRDPLAFQYYDNAARINPANDDVKYARAKLLQDLGKADEAIAAYEKLIASGNGCPNCCYNIGAIYLNIKEDRKKALEWFTKAIETEPGYGEAYFARGYTYSLLGRKDEAREDYRRCLSLIPNYEPALTGLNEL
jgi:tetratricopeptide (TPR) repeat protein